MGGTISRRAALAGLGLAALGAPAARAAETLRVGKAVLEQYGYIPLDVGMSAGIFAQQGLAIEASNFTGGGKLAQAVASGAIDIALSAGPDMAFTAKGAPMLAVGTITHSPAFMAVLVGNQFKGRGIDDLKGKRIGVSTVGSLTYWLVDELNRVEGWTGSDRAVAAAIGAAPTTVYASLKTGEVDASIGSPQIGYQLEAAGIGRMLAPISAYVKEIELFVTMASTALIKDNPGAVRRFLKAWYDTIAFMATHKAESSAAAMRVTGYSREVADRSWDDLMPQFSTDGKFDKAAMDKLFSSFVALKTLDPGTDMTKLYTEEFLPGA